MWKWPKLLKTLNQTANQSISQIINQSINRSVHFIETSIRPREKHIVVFVNFIKLIFGHSCGADLANSKRDTGTLASH